MPWPIALAGDKGYRADGIDACLMALGISPVIPSKSNEDREARQVSFSSESCGVHTELFETVNNPSLAKSQITR